MPVNATPITLSSDTAMPAVTVAMSGGRSRRSPAARTKAVPIAQATLISNGTISPSAVSAKGANITGQRIDDDGLAGIPVLIP